MVGDFKNITVVGLGMIGGSITKALKTRGFNGHVFGLDKNTENIGKVYREGFIDNSDNDFKMVISRTDLVVLATPVSFFPSVLQSIKDDLKKGCIITDVGSVKRPIHKLVSRILGTTQNFVGGHPMVGSEKSGFVASKLHLFENAYYFLTSDLVQTEVLSRVKEFVDFLGAKACIVKPDEHDRIVARTSHIPHINAALLVNLLEEDGCSLIDYVGGGFKDITRIAAGNPDMWSDIILSNKEEIIFAIDEFAQRLERLKRNIIEEKKYEIINNLNKAKSLREKIPKHLIDSIEPEYAVFVDAQDKPGVIASVFALMEEHEINIKDIEILHARETESGVLKVGFYTEAESCRAKSVLAKWEFGYKEMKEDIE